MNINFSTKYINPDIFYQHPSHNSVTFIYTSEGQLYTGHGSLNHIELQYDAGIRQKNITKVTGRTGEYEGDDIVSFWWTEGQLKLMKPCLQELLNKKIITPNYLVSLPGNVELITVQDYLKGNKDVFKTFDKETYNKERDLHLLRGDEKRQALLAKGVMPKIRKSPLLNTIGDHFQLDFKKYLHHENSSEHTSN